MKKMLVILSCLLCQTAWAGWSLNNDQSKLNFISTKNSSKTEIHHFKKLSGSISDQGNATLSIDLNSVETHIPIRNERMQKFLFKVDSFPSAKISLQVDAKKLKSMNPGDSFEAPVQATLDLHGVSNTVESQVRVVALQNGALDVATVWPTVVNVADFDLLEGVKKLQEIAKLKSIDSAVPVTFNLIFENK